jgi:hypothetical protein
MKQSITYSILAFATVLVGSSATTPGSVGKCQPCDRDSDCVKGLWCPDDHTSELEKKGYDKRKADCGSGAGRNKNDEVCFDPKILERSSSGFGGKFNVKAGASFGCASFVIMYCMMYLKIPFLGLLHVIFFSFRSAFPHV